MTACVLQSGCVCVCVCNYVRVQTAENSWCAAGGVGDAERLGTRVWQCNRRGEGRDSAERERGL